MGGKSSTSTNTVSIPPSVLAQYNSVNAKANATANTPFKDYTGQFVAPVNAEQQTGITNTNTAANEAQPYYSAATGTLGKAQAGTTAYNNTAASALGAAQAGTNAYNAAAASNLNAAQAGTGGYNAAAVSNLNAAQAGTTGVNKTAEGLAAASGQAVNPTALTSQDINQYLSPYLSDVVGSEAALLDQNNQQQQAGQLGTAISSGAFGGDRTGIAAANLEQQQNLSNASIYSNLLNQGYNTALSTAQQQQGVGLAAAQANRAALGSAGSELASIGQTAYGEGANTASQAAALGQTAYGEGANTAAQAAALGQTAYGEGANTASQAAALGQTAYGEGANTATEMGALGSSAQTAGLQGANAQLAAGTVQQQTQQAQDTAGYQQFLQQQSYPFQVDQFLANIAEGTGALSGSTTTTTQPGGFFSDKRLKSDVKKIGELYDGQDIVSYKMHGDPRTRIGLIAQDVEKKHPGAVGLAAGFKTVDYGKATEKAARKGKFAAGGVAGYDSGGMIVSPSDYSAILQAQQAMYAPMAGSSGPYGGVAGSVPRGGSARVPAPEGATPHLVTAQGGVRQQPTGLQNAAAVGDVAKTYGGLYSAYKKAHPGEAGGVAGAAPDPAPDAAPVSVQIAGGSNFDGSADTDRLTASNFDGSGLARGGRARFDQGGTPYETVGLDIPDDPNERQLQTGTGGVSARQSGLSVLSQLGGLANDVVSLGDLLPFARGGVAGRRGYADGGDPTDDADAEAIPDPRQLNPRKDPVAAPVGLAAATTAPPAKSAPAASGEPEDHWWKHASNVVPLLQGIAAMGTAPTRHLGVALASGLGAGAQAYLPAQQESLENQGLDIQNQIARQKLGYLTQPPPSAATSQPTATVPKPTNLAEELRQKYAVNPAMTPQEQARYAYAQRQSTVLGQAPVQTVLNDYKQRLADQKFHAQQDAQNNYDQAYYVATHAQDPNVKKSATAAVDAYQQWTGDTPINQNGVVLNSRKLQPFIGAEAQRLSPDTYTNMKAGLMERVPVSTGNPNDPGETVLVPKWKRDFPQAGSVEEAMSTLPPSGTPDVPGRTGAQAAPPRGAAPTANTPPAQPAIQPKTPNPPPATPAPRPSDFLDKTIHDKAFADPQFRLPQNAGQMGKTVGTATAGKADANTKARAELQQDSSSTVQSASAAIQYAKAAQDILNSKGAPTVGRWGPAQKAIDSWVGSGHDASNYEELAKYLGNLAVQSGKGNFPNATQKEVGIQFEQLSPSTANNEESLKNLLNSIVRQNTYMRDTANRATEYLDDGPNGYNGRALDFFKWNQKYYPRESVNTPKSHLDYLVKHPETAPDFKKKYGWLPGGG